MAKKKNNSGTKAQERVDQRKSAEVVEIKKLAASEDIALPEGIADADVKSYVLAEMDRRLSEFRQKPKEEDLKHPAEVEQAASSMLSEDAVREALARHIESGMSFDVDEDGVWVMKKGIKEDCGNFGLPLRRIVQCADMVCRRTFVPRLEKDGKDKVLMVG